MPEVGIGDRGNRGCAYSSGGDRGQQITTKSDTEEQHAERQAQRPTNPRTCHRKTTRERAAASSSEQQESSGAVTSAAANMATGMTDSASSKTCGEKVGGVESSKISDNRADCQDHEEYDDTADHTKA